LDLESDIDLNLDRVPKNQAKKSRLFSPVPIMEKFSNLLIERDQAALLHYIRKLGLKKFLLRLSAVEQPREPVNPQTRDHLRKVFREDTCELERLLETV
jgi:GAF domain-containing protein